MMKNKIVSGVLALVMSVSAFAFPVVSAEQTVFVEYTGYNMEHLDSIISEFREAYKTSGNDNIVREYIIKLTDEMGVIESQASVAYVNYCKDATEENAFEYTKMNNVYATVSSKIYSELVNAGNSGYDRVVCEFFETDEMPEYDSEAMEYEQAMSAEKLRIESEYASVVQSASGVDEKNQQCAELYLELVKLCNDYISYLTEGAYDNYIDYAYATYSRDYSPQDIISISGEAREYLKGYYNDVVDMFQAVRQSDTNTRTYEDNFEIIGRYAGKISDELAESVQWLRENQLYSIGGGSQSMPMSFTSLLPQYDSPYIYQYKYDTVNDLFTSVHEFGHFNAARNSLPDAWYEIDSTNLDIAEVHSQGLEALFTNYYDEIFGTSSDACRYIQLSDMISAISAGFMVNEFECYIFSNYTDEMTADDVISKYNELKDSYEIYPIDMYRISHLFQTPGYYISYAVSALAALEIWGVMQYDYDRAVQMYMDFTHCSYLDDEYTFMASLEKCGFSNVLGEGYISTTLAEYVEKIISQNVMGDVDENGVVTALDLQMLITALLSSDGAFNDEQVKLYDLNNDGLVSVSDALKLKMYLIKN